jgi:peptidyl-prolyl cis-trans isomerase A (cyclophilin A)
MLTLIALFLLAAAQPAEPPPAPAEPEPAPAPALPTPAPLAPLPPPKPAGPRVVLQTGAGAITVELDRINAPVTTANFLKYVDQGRFDGTSFYRAYKLPVDRRLGLIQAGVSGRANKVLPPIAHEPTSKTGLSHTDGAISMARTTPGTAQGDFFIIVGDLTTLDANAKDPGYAVFGRIVDGMEVVNRILDAPTSPTLGSAAMKGQMIAKPVPLATAKRVK